MPSLLDVTQRDTATDTARHDRSGLEYPTHFRAPPCDVRFMEHRRRTWSRRRWLLMAGFCR